MPFEDVETIPVVGVPDTDGLVIGRRSDESSTGGSGDASDGSLMSATNAPQPHPRHRLLAHPHTIRLVRLRPLARGNHCRGLAFCPLLSGSALRHEHPLYVVGDDSSPTAQLLFIWFPDKPALGPCFQIARPVGVRLSRTGPLVVGHNRSLLCELTPQQRPARIIAAPSGGCQRVTDRGGATTGPGSGRTLFSR